MSDTPPGQHARRLWLVRHGETTWSGTGRFCGHSDTPLSARGRLQARWLGQTLRRRPIAAIHSSDLARARETAQLLAASVPSLPPPVLSPLWREVSFGKWEGLTYEDIATQYPDDLAFFADPMRFGPPGGESVDEVLQRLRQGLEALQPWLNRKDETEMVLVSHGGTLRLLLCQLLALPIEHQWRLRVDLGSLSALDIIPDTVSIPTQAVIALLNMTGPGR